MKIGDKVLIVTKNNIQAVVLGFYNYTMDVRVRTKAGREWIISPIYLEKVVDARPKT